MPPTRTLAVPACYEAAEWCETAATQPASHRRRPLEVPIFNAAAEVGALGCIGDARTAKLGTRENVWVCPPLAVVQQSIMVFMERRTVGTVIVPEWEAQAWYVWVRGRAVHSMH